MLRKLIIFGIAFAFSACLVQPAEAGTSLLGGGIHYWRTIDDIDEEEEFDEDGVAWVISYQLLMGMARFQADLEFLPDDFGGSDDQVLAPQGYLLIGRGLYAGLGVGWYYDDDGFYDDPFYALRAGIEIPLGGITLDLHGNYRVNEFDDLDNVDDVDGDTITLGAALRFAL